jgi:hypothetical protein
MFGDSLGGVLYFVYLIVYGLAHYAPDIIAAVTKSKFGDLEGMLPNV